MFEGKTILVAPLDWGLGHASRCVPLIRQLSKKNEVIIGVTQITSSLLGAYFPGLKKVELPSYKMSYSKLAPQWLSVLLNLRSTLKVISKEKNETRRYVEKHHIDVVLSDNRYGVYNSTTTNIFICHQVNLQLPFFSGIMNLFHARQFKHFSELWIPDYADSKKRLAGKLSDDSFLKIRHSYIGPLTALNTSPEPTEATYDYLFLLSGPEPQRTLLEKKLLGLVKGKNKKIALVRGITSTPGPTLNVDYQKDLCTGEELSEIIKSSHTVVCRSGYSTLMDLHLLGKKEMILIPTPGQPEQEYLAEHWKKNFGAKVVKQGLIQRITI